MRPDDAAERLIAALRRRDDVTLARLLAPEARLTLDTGDHGGGSVRGRARVIRALDRLLVDPPGTDLEPAQVNGCPGLALRRGAQVIGVLALDRDIAVGDPAAIADLWLVTAPAKLGHWNRGEVRAGGHRSGCRPVEADDGSGNARRPDGRTHP